MATVLGGSFYIALTSTARDGALRLTIIGASVTVNGALATQADGTDKIFLFYTDPSTGSNASFKLTWISDGEYSTIFDTVPGTYPEGYFKVGYSLDDGLTSDGNLFNLQALPLSGGGGGGGGGNNGGTGYNNMSTLTFNPAYQVDASHSSSVVVYGETAVTRPEYTDSLAITVSAANLNKVLSFAKDGEAAATDFKVNLDSIKAAVKTALEARLQTDHALPSLSSMGIDARSILSQTLGAWAADVAPLAVDKTGDVARNVYEQAADKGKLSATLGELNLSSGDTFTFYMDTTATQSLEISIDSGTLAGASTSDVTPLIPLAAIFGATNAAGDKGTITKSWPYKFAVTATVE